MEKHSDLYKCSLGPMDFDMEIWNGSSSLPVSPLIAVDTETEEIIKGSPIVPVCIQVYWPHLQKVIIAAHDLFEPFAEKLIESHAKAKWVMHNCGFDLSVLDIRNDPRLIRLVDQKQVIDTGMRYLLKKLADGGWGAGDHKRWSLDIIAKELLDIELPKDDEIRLGFKRNQPLTDDMLEYAAGDPVATLHCIEKMREYMPTEDLQVKASIVCQYMSQNGLMVDQNRREELCTKFTTTMTKASKIINAFGYHPGETGNQGVMQRLLENLEIRTGFAFPRTDKKGTISLSKEALADMELDHSLINALKEHDHASMMMEKYLNEDFIGADGRVHPFFNPLVATGRTSASRPPVQQMPRDEDIRSVFRAADGCLLYIPDYRQLELCTLAESCYQRFKESKLGDLINAGEGVHDHFGAKIREKRDLGPNVDYRQMAKAFTFGKPGGLGIKTFVTFAWVSYGVQVTEDQVVELSNLWLETFPEMRMHLDVPVDPRHSGRYIGATRTGRIRKGASFCQAANYEFQGLASDGAKETMWRCFKAGLGLVNFVHDELQMEVPIDNNMQDRCDLLDKIMIDTMQEFTPHVKIAIESALMQNWHKVKNPIFDAKGRRLIWTPEIRKEKSTQSEESKVKPSEKRSAYDRPVYLKDGSFFGWQDVSTLREPEPWFGKD